jgi:RNA polymerase sigma factor (sigma-70 family)
MKQSRKEIVAWVGANVLPHEGDVRGWLRRTGAADQVDDVVQEAYCRIASLSSVAHILNGRAYFFQTARNIALGHARRARVVHLDWLTEIELASIADSEPSPERIVAGRRELRRIERLIEDLPEPCREIFKLRRIQAVPQKEIAQRLGVTENVVEMQAIRGLQLILAALKRSEAQGERPREEPHDHRSNRRRDR